MSITGYYFKMLKTPIKVLMPTLIFLQLGLYSMSHKIYFPLEHTYYCNSLPYFLKKAIHLPED